MDAPPDIIREPLYHDFLFASKMPFSLDGNPAALGALLASFSQIVLVVDTEGVIRYINRVEPGYDRDSVIGTHSRDQLFADSWDVFQAALNSVLSTGERAEFEVQVSPPAGDPLWYRSQMTPYFQGSQVVGAMIVASNVTELREAQQTVNQLRQLLPVCSWCNKIRNADDSWESLEKYLGHAVKAQVTHGVCPDCFDREMRHS